MLTWLPPSRWATDDMIAEVVSPVAVGRAEDEPCQRLTVGCSVDHAQGEYPCETW